MFMFVSLVIISVFIAIILNYYGIQATPLAMTLAMTLTRTLAMALTRTLAILLHYFGIQTALTITWSPYPYP